MLKTVFLIITSWLLAILPGLGFLIAINYPGNLIFQLNRDDKIPNWINSLGSVFLLIFIALSVLIIKRAIKVGILPTISSFGVLMACTVVIFILTMTIVFATAPIGFFLLEGLSNVLKNLLNSLNILKPNILDILVIFLLPTLSLTGALFSSLLSIFLIKIFAGLINIEELVLATLISSIVLSIAVFFVAVEKLGKVAGLLSLATLTTATMALFTVIIAVVMAKSAGDITMAIAIAVATVVPSSFLITIFAVGSAGSVIEGAKTLLIIGFAVVPAVLGGASIGWKMING